MPCFKYQISVFIVAVAPVVRDVPPELDQIDIRLQQSTILPEILQMGVLVVVEDQLAVPAPQMFLATPPADRVRQPIRDRVAQYGLGPAITRALTIRQMHAQFDKAAVEERMPGFDTVH